MFEKKMFTISISQKAKHITFKEHKPNEMPSDKYDAAVLNALATAIGCKIVSLTSDKEQIQRLLDMTSKTTRDAIGKTLSQKHAREEVGDKEK